MKNISHYIYNFHPVVFSGIKNLFSDRLRSSGYKYMIAFSLSMSIPIVSSDNKNPSYIPLSYLLWSNTWYTSSSSHPVVSSKSNSNTDEDIDECYLDGKHIYHPYKNTHLIDSTRLSVDLNDRINQHHLTIQPTDKLFVRGALIRQHADNIREYITQCIQTKLGNTYPKLIATLIAGCLLDEYISINYQSTKRSSKLLSLTNNDTIFLPSAQTYNRLFANISSKKQLDSLVKQYHPHFNSNHIVSKSIWEQWLFDNLNTYNRYHNTTNTYINYRIVSAYIQSHGHRLWSTALWYEEDGSSFDFFRTGTEITKSAFLHLQSILTQFSSDNPNTILIFSGMRELGHSLTNQWLIGTKPWSIWRKSKLMTYNQSLESHELGHCMDLRMIWLDGFILYQWIKKNTKGIKKKDELKVNKRYTYNHIWVRFDYIYHGEGIIGKHFHIYLR